MFDHLPAWPVAAVVASFLLLVAVSWGYLAQKSDELKAGIDRTLDRRIEEGRRDDS